MIVSGAGPSGSIAAHQCAKMGMSTLLLERNSIPREKCCAGGMLQRAIDFLPFELPSSVVEREIMGFTVQIGDYRKEFTFDRRAGVVVKRSKLDEFLAKKAEAAGAELMEGACALSATESGSGVTLVMKGSRLEAKAMIIAEGVTSRTARSLLGNYPREHLAMGAAVNLEVDGDPGDRIELHLIDTPTKRYRPQPDFPLNGWMFPHRSGANIGVVGKGVNKERLHASIASIKKNFEERCGPIASEGAISSHPIPIVPRKVLGTRRVLAVGDAAGFVNPLTGEGMTYSILSGKIAAQTVNERLENGFGREAIRRYDERCAELILKDLRAAARISPILHRLVGVVEVRSFFDHFQEDRALVEVCLRIARGEQDWRALLRRAIPMFPVLFFSSLS